jgi:hypothetical protein
MLEQQIKSPVLIDQNRAFYWDYRLLGLLSWDCHRDPAELAGSRSQGVQAAVEAF